MGLELDWIRIVARSSTTSSVDIVPDDSIFPPPVALPGVFGGGGGMRHGPDGGACSHGSKSTFCSRSRISSPIPVVFRGTSLGPDASPHQLFSALSWAAGGAG